MLLSVDRLAVEPLGVADFRSPVLCPCGSWAHAHSVYKHSPVCPFLCSTSPLVKGKFFPNTKNFSGFTGDLLLLCLSGGVLEGHFPSFACSWPISGKNCSIILALMSSLAGKRRARGGNLISNSMAQLF